MSEAPARLYALRDWRIAVTPQPAMPLRALETVLEYHGFAPIEGGAARWSFAYDAEVARPPEARLVAEHASGLGIYRVDERFYLEHATGSIEIDTAAGRVRGVLPGADSAEAVSVTLYVVVTFTLLLLFETDGWYALHGACLVAPDGRGVLLVGPSDSGKSTMALHLAEQGWRYLSDDSVLLRLDGSRVTAYPFRPDFCLDPEAETLFASLSTAREAMLTDADKWRVRVDALFPGQRAASVAPVLVVLPTISGEPLSRAERLRPVAMLTGLMPQASLLRRTPDEARTFTTLLHHLARQAPGYRFLSGHDVYRDGARLAALLTDLLPDPYAHASSES